MVTLLLFHRISKTSSTALHSTQYHLTELLHQNNLLDKVICMFVEGDCDIPKEKIIQMRSNRVYKTFDKVFKRIESLFPSFNKRHYLELLFDRIAYKHIDFKSTTLVYSSKPLFSYCFEKCKSHNTKTILRASIAHPLFNYTLIRNEQLKLNIKSSGSYTNINRALKLSKTFHLADKVMVNYAKTSDEFLTNTYKYYIEPKKLILYKHPFIRLENNNFPVKYNQEPFLFIHVARMGLIKNTHFLIETWKEFISKHPVDAELLLIGNFDDNLKQLLPLKYLRKIKNLKLAGVVDNPFGKYQYANALICPSISDMGPATVIESLSAGIPVICSKNCGLSHMIEDKKNGLLFDFNDSNSLMRAMLWFVNHQHLKSELSQSAYNAAQELSLEKFKQEMWAIFSNEI